VSTRKLILLALACGLAILVAGSIQILRIRDSETVTLVEGDSTELAALRASVVSSTVMPGETVVVVNMALASGAAEPITDAAVGWTLLSSTLDAPVAATRPRDGGVPPCAGTSITPGTSAQCALGFAWNPEDPGDTGFVTLRFVGAQATWTLSV
jgi:hypothetical protein